MADPQKQLDKVREDIDRHWADYAKATRDLNSRYENIVHESRGVTGLDLTPGARALIDRLLVCAVEHCDDLQFANIARSEALIAQTERDRLLGLVPPPPVTPTLDQMDRQVLRSTLKSANDATLRGWLDELHTADARKEWAQVMLAWVEADGNTHNIISLLRQYATVDVEPPPPDLNAGLGTTSTYTKVR